MTPEEIALKEKYKKAAAKGLATKKANKAAKEAAEQERAKYAGELGERIRVLEKKLEYLQNVEALSSLSHRLTGNSLLDEGEIVKSSSEWGTQSGIYFLIHGKKVVYVGQSVNIYARVAAHKHDKKIFDRFAYVPCPPVLMDKLESLYIHCLKPSLNGTQLNGVKCAPIQLKDLLGLDNLVLPEWE